MTALRYTATFLERDFVALNEFLFQDYAVERAAILRCRASVTDDEVRFLVRAVHCFDGADLNHATEHDVSIKSTAFMPVLKAADRSREAIIFVHSHPGGTAFFSPQDNRTEPPFFRTAFTRIDGALAHGSLIFSDPGTFIGRVWLTGGSTAPLTDLRVIGDRWRFMRSITVHDQLPEFFDRQVRAFGPDVQRVLGHLHVGVVGAGGTGSPTIEQLIRLGVGTLTVIDDQAFERSNVNRVYNSGVGDDGTPKVDIVRRTVAAIGLGTKLRTIQGRITQESVAKALRACDVIFGCTDDNWGRAVLNALALRYLVPVLDLGVKITSEDGAITQVIGRVTTLLPGNACLHCRRRIDPERARQESLHPDELARLRGLGYAQGLDEPAPAVVSFTSFIAATATTEFLHRLTGFMGDDSVPGEILHYFADRRMSTNRGQPQPECACQNPQVWGAGDTRLFLDMTWPEASLDPFDSVMPNAEMPAA